MANKIQIKRSSSNTTIPTLANGELAFTGNGNILYIGKPDGSGNLRIGGAQVPGTLTANQAVVVNSTSGIDQFIVGNLQPFGIYANGSAGSSGQVLASNGSAVYWLTPQEGDITSVTAGNGLTGGGLSGDVTLDVGSGNGISVSANAIDVSVGANSGLTVNTSGLYIASGNGLVTNSTYISVQANNGIVSNTSGVWVKTANGIAVDSSGVNVNPNNGIVSNSSGVFAKASNGIAVDSSGINVNTATNSGLVVNTSGVWVKAGTGVTVNSSGVNIGQSVGTTDNVTFANVVTGDLTVNGNTTLGDSAFDRININGELTGNLMPSVNAAYYVGNNTMRWNEVHAVNVHSISGYFDGTVQISGDLIVSGNVTTTNVASLSVSDPLIYLAGNNYSSDLLDIGFAGNYNNGAANVHTGLIRHASDDTYYLFKGLTQELSATNVVNTADPSFTIADLSAYLKSGAFTSNTVAVTITANSTVNVNITANSLSLSSALSATSGGTGTGNYTSGDLLVANTGNTLTKLGIGTDGYVLQVNGTTVVWDILDGGTF